MRSIAVFLAVFSTLPVALIFPFAGLLLWAWIAFMNPHREAFGLAFDFPFNYYIAVVTLAAWVFSAESKRVPAQALVGLFFAFAVVISVTTYFALDHAYAFERWDRHIRTMVLLLVVVALANTRLRIQAFLWIIALSIGYFAVKGGGFFLVTGGGDRIYGPPDSAIAGNNELAVAICMALPLLQYLRVTTVNPVVKLVCVVVFAFGVLAVVGTLSRSGFVALVVMGIGSLLFYKPKLGPVVVAVALGLFIWNYAPVAWFERVKSIETYEQDASVNNRFVAWRTSWRLALDRPLLGGGFSVIETEKVDFRYNKPDWRNVGGESRYRAAHSIYFQVLGDHGFLGLAVWLLIIAFGVSNLIKVLALSRDREDLAWTRTLARALTVSFLAFLSGGAFLSMAYYDVFFCLVALTVPLREIVTRAAQAKAPQSADLVGDFVLESRTARAKR